MTAQPTTAGEATARQLLPLTVWLCADSTNDDNDNSHNHRAAALACAGAAPCPHGGGVFSHALATNLISTCSRPGDLVIETDPLGEATLAAAAAGGRRAIACVPHLPLAQLMWQRLRRDLSADQLRSILMCPAQAERIDRVLAGYRGAATLVVTAPPCPNATSCPSCATSTQPRNETAVLAGAWRLLRGGGHLAVITAAHRGRGGHGAHRGDERDCSPGAVGLHDPGPQLVRAALAVGFGYTQHIIALRVPVRAGQLVLQPTPTSLAQIRDADCDGPPPAVTVHADVYLFTKSASAAPTAAGAR